MELVVQAERAIIDVHIGPAGVTVADGGIARDRAFDRPTEDGMAQLRSMWEASA